MNLYVLITRGQIGNTIESSLVAACKRASLGYKLLVIEDIALDDVAAMDFPAHSLLYRVSTKKHAANLESAIMLLHPGKCTTILQPHYMTARTRQHAGMIKQIAAGLPIVPSRIVDATWLAAADTKILEKVKALGGFPVLYKALGMSHGQGVRKVDSLTELRTLIRQVNFAREEVIVREYLPHYRHYRLVVVDDEVAAAIEYHKPANDFRTNAASIPQVSAMDIATMDPVVLDIAVRAVGLTSSILGGVDILFDTAKDLSYLAEVNVPCNFSRAEAPTGVDISGRIIAALQRKSELAQ